MNQTYYQGGEMVVLFTPQGKDSLATWKVQGQIKKLYDKPSKGFLLACTGGTSTQLQLPKSPNTHLGLTQPFLMIQMLPGRSTSSFSIEIGVLDTERTRRRLMLSTSFQKVVANRLHAQIPFASLKYKKGSWIDLCLDVVYLMAECFPEQTFRAIDSICISGTCKIRRVYTLRNAPLPRHEDENSIPEYDKLVDIPRAVAFPISPDAKCETCFMILPSKQPRNNNTTEDMEIQGTTVSRSVKNSQKQKRVTVEAKAGSPSLNSSAHSARQTKSVSNLKEARDKTNPKEKAVGSRSQSQLLQVKGKERPLSARTKAKTTNRSRASMLPSQRRKENEIKSKQDRIQTADRTAPLQKSDKVKAQVKPQKIRTTPRKEIEEAKEDTEIVQVSQGEDEMLASQRISSPVDREASVATPESTNFEDLGTFSESSEEEDNLPQTFDTSDQVQIPFGNEALKAIDRTIDPGLEEADEKLDEIAPEHPETVPYGSPHREEDILSQPEMRVDPEGDFASSDEEIECEAKASTRARPSLLKEEEESKSPPRRIQKDDLGIADLPVSPKEKVTTPEKAEEIELEEEEEDEVSFDFKVELATSAESPMKEEVQANANDDEEESSEDELSFDFDNVALNSDEPEVDESGELSFDFGNMVENDADEAGASERESKAQVDEDIMERQQDDSHSVYVEAEANANPESASLLHEEDDIQFLDKFLSKSPVLDRSESKVLHQQKTEHIDRRLSILSNQSSNSDDSSNEHSIELLFDPVLNCYYDPQSNKYYELRATD